ncbi:helix-turn-helix domain-containing protein [Luminiphilus sp.]|nr:helix-turn-helix domain-containing protein [Luminiphilus sp.]
MAIETKCLTPGAVFETHIQDESLSVRIDFGRKIDLSETEAELLEALVHNQLESALAQFWPEDKPTTPVIVNSEIKEISSMAGGSIEGHSGPLKQPKEKKKKKKVKEWLSNEIFKILVE